MKARTLIVGGLAAAGLAGLVAWGLRPDPVPVDLAEVTQGSMRLTVNADGKTRIRNVYEVAAPISGRAQRSPVQVGDRVIAGRTVVAVVQPMAPELLDARSRRQAEAAVDEAQAALQVALSRLKQAGEDLAYATGRHARTLALTERGVATTSQLVDAAQRRAVAEAALETARSTQAMAEGALARARAVLIAPVVEGESNGACCVELHAPADGVVLSVDSLSERPVTIGTPLLTLGRPTDLEIVADLLSADAVRLAPGSRVIVERWGGERPLDAILRKIAPSARTKVSALGIEEQRVDVFVDLLSSPRDRPGLGDGFSVFLRIVEWQEENVVQVPLSALFRSNGDWFAFRVSDGIASRVPVRIGRRNDRAAQVLSGLSPGDVVVTHPSDRVQDATPIVDRATLE